MSQVSKRLEIIIAPLEGGGFSVNAVLMQGDIALGGTGGLGTTYPATWGEVIQYATRLLEGAAQQGIVEQLTHKVDDSAVWKTMPGWVQP